MSTITKIVARMIYDSRGFPSTEVEVFTDEGMFRASCPSGASTGIHEALELRDGGADWMGKGVEKALEHIRKDIAPHLVGMKVDNQKAIDDKLAELDGTKNFGKFGANACLPVSMACCIAGAHYAKMPVHAYIHKISGTKAEMSTPVPCMNIINGGKHAGNKLAPQEYMIAPFGATSFHEAMKMGSEVYQNLKSILAKRYGIEATAVGDEGGFAPPIDDPKAPLETICEAIEKAGYKGRIGICMDAAASEFYDKDAKVYNLNFKGETPRNISGEELAKLYLSWCKEFPIVSIEDPFDEDDFESFADLLRRIKEEGLNVQIVGDDLTVSNSERVKMAEEHKACNALLLKVNQIGSVQKAIDAALLAQSYGWSVMVSHRSGETEDTFIAELVAGLGTGQIKSGAPCRGERTCKYNQLLRIEEADVKKFGYDKWHTK